MKRQRLYVKPRRPPKWWPRSANGRFKFVAVLENGEGWSVGEASPLTPKQIAVAKQGMRDTFGSMIFEVR